MHKRGTTFFFHVASLNFKKSSEDRNLSEMKSLCKWPRRRKLFILMSSDIGNKDMSVMYTLVLYIPMRMWTTHCLKVTLPRKTSDHCFVREMKRKTKKREKRGGKERKREIKREDNRGREREGERGREGGTEGGWCMRQKTEKDRLKSFKLFFPLNNPSFVQI